MKNIRYTSEETEYCEGFECIYRVYKSNAFWKHTGTIYATLHNSNECVIERKEDKLGVFVEMKDILSIPMYDACKGTAMLRLIRGDMK